VDGPLAPRVFTRLPLTGEDPARLTFGNVNQDDPMPPNGIKRFGIFSNLPGHETSSVDAAKYPLSRCSVPPQA
jgi:hypothetical protein